MNNEHVDQLVHCAMSFNLACMCYCLYDSHTNVVVPKVFVDPEPKIPALLKVVENGKVVLTNVDKCSGSLKKSCAYSTIELVAWLVNGLVMKSLNLWMHINI